MSTKNYLVSLIVIVFTALFFAFLVVLNNSTTLSPKTSSLEECNSLQDNAREGINLLFFTDKKTTEKYSNVLLSQKPFADNKDGFNIYYINNFAPECELYKGVALLCSNKELVTKAASCPNDYIFVVQENSESIRSSALTNIASINKNNPLTVVLHEFGHTFGGLAEEYVPASIPFNSKNCASSCASFEGKEECC